MRTRSRASPNSSDSRLVSSSPPKPAPSTTMRMAHPNVRPPPTSLRRMTVGDAAPSGWLADAVVYEIYPQSFADSDGDGIGDLPGAMTHLDHLEWLGIDTIWFNPCFASPFVDAGYDVSDYLRVAPRYGTNDDLVAFVDAARRRGIRVLLDLVAGHTSVEHQWFQDELHADGPVPEGDRYIWSDRPGVQSTSQGSPGATPWVAVARPTPWLLPQELLRRPAGVELRVRRAARRRALAGGGRRPRTSAQPAGAARHHGVLARPRGGRLPGRHGVLPGQGRPGLRRDHAAVARAARLARRRPIPRRSSSPRAPNLAGLAEPAFHADFFLVIDRPHCSLFDNGGAGTFPGRPRRGPPFFDADGGGVDRTSSWPRGRARGRTGRTGRSCWRPPTTTSPGWRAAPGARPSSARPSRSC